MLECKQATKQTILTVCILLRDKETQSVKYTVRHMMTLAAKEEKAAKESVSCVRRRGAARQRGR